VVLNGELKGIDELVVRMMDFVDDFFCYRISGKSQHSVAGIG
jgi:hypothetical protein